MANERGDVDVTVSDGLPLRQATPPTTPEQRLKAGRFHEGGLHGVSLHRHERGVRLTMPDQRLDGVPTVLLSADQARKLVDSLEAWLDEQPPAKADKASEDAEQDVTRKRHT